MPGKGVRSGGLNIPYDLPAELNNFCSFFESREPSASCRPNCRFCPCCGQDRGLSQVAALAWYAILNWAAASKNAHADLQSISTPTMRGQSSAPQTCTEAAVKATTGKLIEVVVFLLTFLFELRAAATGPFLARQLERATLIAVRLFATKCGLFVGQSTTITRMCLSASRRFFIPMNSGTTPRIDKIGFSPALFVPRSSSFFGAVFVTALRARRRSRR